MLAVMTEVYLIFIKEGAITIGIEPTNAVDEARLKGHHIYKSYFDKKTILKLKKFKKLI